MGRLPLLIFLSVFLLAFDYYCFRAVLSVFKNWKPNTKKWFTILWWGYTLLLVLGVFTAIYANLFLSLRSIILVAFFLTVTCKIVMLPFLLIDDLRRLFILLTERRKGKVLT
ncbi:MAG: metallophosphoesterase, partial [Pedobacter sp.]